MKINENPYRVNSVMLLDDNEIDNFITEKMLRSTRFARNIYVHTSSKSGLEFLSNIEALSEEYSNLFLINKISRSHVFNTFR